MADQQPKLRLTFTGEGFPKGAVPLNVVATKLQALQQAVFHAAAAASAHRGARRGQWFNRYRSSAELTFSAAHRSDLTIEAELSADPVLREDFDVGLEAVDLLFEVATSLEQNDLAGLQDKKIAPYDRDYLVRAIEGLMPNVGDQYQIKIENCRPEKHPVVTFSGSSRLVVRNYAARAEPSFDAEMAIIVGELIKIHVDAGEDKITVRSRQRDIDCFYSDALRDQVANLIAGSIVEVSGFATVDSTQQVVKLHSMVDVEPASMEPLRIGKFEHGGRAFTLASPIAVNVEYTDGLWVYHYAELNLWGYAARREDALRELNESFAYIYREIAEEQPGNLDSVAQRLRERLLQLVSTPGGGVHA